MNESGEYRNNITVDTTDYDNDDTPDRVLQFTLAVLGTIGNILTLCVLHRPMFIKRSVSVFLSSLAVADIITLWINMVYTGVIGFGLPHTLHELVTWVFYLTGMTSSWSIVLVCIERLVAIWTPYKVKEIFRRNRSILITVLMWITCASVSGIMFEVAYDPVPIWWTLYVILPSCIIVVCNMILLVKMHLAKVARQEMIAGHSANEQSHKTTIMLLVNSFAFVILTFPSALINFLSSAGDFISLRAMIIMFRISFILLTTNHAVNFLLYCLSGSMFRHELRLMFVNIFSRMMCSQPLNCVVQ